MSMSVQPRGPRGFISRSGQPPRTATLRELALSPDRILQRVAMMDTAYREAIAGNVRWATFIASVSGELAQVQVNVLQDSPMIAAVNGLRVAMGLPALGEPQAIDTEATLVQDIRSTETEADASTADQAPAP